MAVLCFPFSVVNSFRVNSQADLCCAMRSQLLSTARISFLSSFVCLLWHQRSCDFPALNSEIKVGGGTWLDRYGTKHLVKIGNLGKPWRDASCALNVRRGLLLVAMALSDKFSLSASQCARLQNKLWIQFSSENLLPSYLPVLVVIPEHKGCGLGFAILQRPLLKPWTYIDYSLKSDVCEN